MANPYVDYQIDIVDVSRYNDLPDTPYKPTFDKIISAGFKAVAVRVGYGRVKDTLFDHFWQNAKGRIYRKPYWYGDYYSHKYLGLTDAQWGKEQGDNWYKMMNGDFGEIPAALDCERSSYGGDINMLNRNSYNVIMRALAERYDYLTGKLTEIYCSPGFIPNLFEWARKRPLWVAWYNRNMTKAQVIDYCRRQGWLGSIRIWQYASDGDINMDGIGDGIALGMETKNLDLNAWLGTIEEWSRYCGTTPPATEPPIVVVPPSGALVQKLKVVAPDGLNVRNKPLGQVGSAVEKWMPKDTIVYSQAVSQSTSSIWHKIGFDQWAAETYNGSTFMVKV